MLKSESINLIHNYPLFMEASGVRDLLRDFTSKIEREPNSAIQFLSVEDMFEYSIPVARWLSAPGSAIAPERIHFGVSGHQVLVACLLALTKPGDKIACDPVTYNGWLNIARLVGRELIAVPEDSLGMLPDALEKVVRQHSPWGIYLMPSLHNPNASVMPLSRRKEIVEVCRRHGLWVIDDDAYRFLNQDSLPSFAHLFPERSLWIQSLTKPLFPSIKTAFLVSPLEVVTQLKEAFRLTSHQPSMLTLPWIVDLLASGTINKIIQEKQNEAIVRQSMAKELLSGLQYFSSPTSFHLWMTLPQGWTEDKALLTLQSEKVGVVSGSCYCVDKTSSPNAIRIALAGESDRARLAEGLIRIKRVLQSVSG